MSAASGSSTIVAAASTTILANQTVNSAPSVAALPAVVDVMPSSIQPSSSMSLIATSSSSSTVPTTPPVTASSKSADNGSSLATKIGVGAGAGVLLLLILIGTCLILRRRRKHSPPTTTTTTSDAAKFKAGTLRPHDSELDTKHPTTLSENAAALELMHKNEANYLLKSGRNKYLAQISEQPGSRRFSHVHESNARSRTISLLAHGSPGAHMSTGHISLIQPDDHISFIAQPRMVLPKIPPIDHLSLTLPGDRNSVLEIQASRQAALDILNGPLSPESMASPTHSMTSQSGYAPSVPLRNPRRNSVRSRGLDTLSLDSRQFVESGHRQRTPVAAEPPPRSGSQSQVVDFHTNSLKYMP